MTGRQIAAVLAVLVYCGRSLANESIQGKYKTITETQCNFTLTLGAKGKGAFVETCRREDGSHIDDIERRKITWKSKDNVLTVVGLGLPYEAFSVHQSLSCEVTGNRGGSFGLRGYGDNYFWKVPRKCR